MARKNKKVESLEKEIAEESIIISSTQTGVEMAGLFGPLATVYDMFLEKLSSGEIMVYLESPERGVFAFKKFLADMPSEKMVELIKGK